MTAQQALANCNEDQHLEDVALGWSESQKVFCETVLEEPCVDIVAEFCGLQPDVSDALKNTVDRIRGNEALLRLLWHCRWRLFEAPYSRELENWPIFTYAFGDLSGCFYLLAGIALVPAIQAEHQTGGIPPEVTRATCMQIRDFCEAYRLGHQGMPGIQRSRISWLRHYIREPMYRIAGLEYRIMKNPVPIHVYRNRASGDIAAFMWQGDYVDADGYIALEGDAERITFAANQNEISGYRFSREGRIRKSPARLPASEWREELAPGSVILQLHLPHGCDVGIPSVQESFREALVFFRRHYPDQTPVAIVSTSWAFSPILDTLLDENSRLVQLQKELYLFSEPAGHGGFSYIFPDDPFDLSAATTQTRLQKEIVMRLNTGGSWRPGGMFFLVKDLAKFGSQCYSYK